METKTTYYPSLEDVNKAKLNLKGIAQETPLMENFNLSNLYKANIFLKREDLQQVRSYKIRGAYNMISNLKDEDKEKGIVCSSAGNHAQGVAFSCNKLKIKGKIFMPETTPKQKVNQVRMFGNGHVEVILTGDTYDDAYNAAMRDCKDTGSAFIPPFDHPLIIEGQATVGLEILQQAEKSIDYIFIPIGGGGLAAGLGSYVKALSPNTKIIGVEPQGAPSMRASLDKGERTCLMEIDKFVDGAAVKEVGQFTYDICKEILDDVISVPEGLVCSTILKLYNQDALVVEPAGALSVAALELYKDKLQGKNVVCIVSGSNNDITRTEEIKERSLLYEGLKHYFIVRFPQRAGALKTFVNEILGANDDITLFEYSKKNNREKGPALVGIELGDRREFRPLLDRFNDSGFVFEYLNDKPDLFGYIVL
jgi:threonine dehydratase